MLLLKYIRVERRKSQHYIAALAQMQQSDLSRMEAGRQTPTHTERVNLARVLECDPAHLLDDVADAELFRARMSPARRVRVEALLLELRQIKSDVLS
jgi:transcriptional regulator with XRE-family HTH domain